jgi:leucyl/phenylalanyl-tRNA---protein transferase
VTVYKLRRDDLAFPPAEHADHDGLLAVGGDLSPRRLLVAYASGIFPWFSHRGVPYWFSPDPRAVVFPRSFVPSRSLARTIRSGRFEVAYDRDFDAVVAACATAPRKHECGSWIGPDFRRAYGALHRMGYARSVETYRDGELKGGLYGVRLGGVFCGESMFSLETDASKVAFASLLSGAEKEGIVMVDCQQSTPHLRSLGAIDIPRSEYLRRLEDALRRPPPQSTP